MKYSKDDLIKYRIQRAHESLDEAKILGENNHWNTVANRLYYACFYIVNALFVKKSINASTHSGAKSQFHLNFIKTKNIAIKFGETYNQLFDKRQTGDYEDFQIFKKEEIKPFINQTAEFIKAIEKLLND